MQRNPWMPHIVVLVALSGLFSSCATDDSTAGDPAYIGPFYGPEYDPYYYDGYWGGGVVVGGGGGAVERPSVPPPRPTHPIARPPVARPMPARGGRR